MEAVMNEERLHELYRQQVSSGCFLDWKEWKDKVMKAYSELIGVAKRGGLITYSELGIGKLRISQEWLYPKIGWILGACSHYEWIENRPLISALVVSKETNRPSKGFWGLPGIPSGLRMSVSVDELDPLIATSPEQDEFWAREVDKVYREWQGKSVKE